MPNRRPALDLRHLIRRPAAGLCLLAALALLITAGAQAQEAQGQPAGITGMLRIGTGGQGGTYFPIGSLIARAISDAPVGPDCQPADSHGGRCGVPGMMGVAQISNGSVANVAALQAGEVELALVQADIASWAFEGREIFAGRPRQDGLRFVAHLYSEAMHVVVRRQAGVNRISDLRGRVVALDEPGSGSLIHVRNLLSAYGLAEGDLRGLYVKPDLALPRMTVGQLDAFFIVAGWPVKTVTDAMATGNATLLPLDQERVRGVMQRNPFLSFGRIPAGTYAGQPEIPTLMVGAQLIARADLPEKTITALLESLWSVRGQHILRTGHPRGQDIDLRAALTGRSIPLHPAAERFYRSRGLTG